MKLVRLAALAAVFALALFVNAGREAQAQGGIGIGSVFCMCACPDGTVICVEDDSPDCGVCATACGPYGYE